MAKAKTKHDAPEAPETPEAPAAPDNPDTPSAPEAPQQPIRRTVRLLRNVGGHLAGQTFHGTDADFAAAGLTPGDYVDHRAITDSNRSL